MKEHLAEVMKLRNELLKATIFKDNHIVNYSFDENMPKDMSDNCSSVNSSPRKYNTTNGNYLKEMDSVLEESSTLLFYFHTSGFPASIA